MATKQRKIIIFIILAALAGGGFLAWRTLGKGGQEPTYATTQVEKGTVVSTVSASGNLLQTNTFTVTTAVTGVVKEVFVKDGEEAAKGQQLIEIEPDQKSEEAKVKMWSSYLTAKSILASAEENKISLEKGLADAQGGLITAKQNAEVAEDWDPTDPDKQKLNAARRSAELTLEIAQQKYAEADEAIKKAQADLDSAGLAYQLTLPTITAPVSGKVSDISVAVGMTISSETQKILTVVGEQRPLVSVSVNEIDIPKISTGKKTTLTFDALPGKTFTGKIIGVDRSGSSTQGVVTYPVLIQLDTGAEQLYPNMSATAEIIVEAKENVLWVPPSAVRTQVGQTIVRVLVNGQVQEKTVKIGLETFDQAEILSGLSEGETVIVSEQTTTTGGQAPSFGGGGGFMRMVR